MNREDTELRLFNECRDLIFDIRREFSKSIDENLFKRLTYTLIDIDKAIEVRKCQKTSI